MSDLERHDSPIDRTRRYGAGPKSEAMPMNALSCFHGRITLVSVVAMAAMFSISSVHGDPGGLDNSFAPHIAGQGGASVPYVGSIAVQPDGKILIGGEFETVEGVTSRRIARLNADGSLDKSFAPPSLIWGGVNCIALQSDGKIIIGGPFTEPRLRLARLNPNGSLDAGFSADLDLAPQCLVSQPDGKIIVGGGFAQVSGVARPGLVRLKPDGTLDTEFNPVLTGDGYTPKMSSMFVQADGKLVIAGYFNTVNGEMRNGLARLNADGTLDTAFAPVLDYPQNVIAPQADGKIVMSGYFTTVGGNSYNRIARINGDGTEDAGFNASADFSAASIIVQADGKIVLAGSFHTVNGVLRDQIARLNADGTLDAGFINSDSAFDFDPSFRSYNYVSGAAAQADGKILIGGSFTGYFGGYLVRLANDPATQGLTLAPNNKVQWLRGGASPEAQNVTFEQSLNGGVSWLALGNGTRIAGGWEIASQPGRSLIRARAQLIGGHASGSTGFSEILASLGWQSAQLTVNANMADGNRTGAAHHSWHLYYYKGTDNKLWASFWSGTQWAQAPLAPAANVADYLTLHPSYGYLYYQGTDGHLWVIWPGGGQWNQAPLTTTGNVAGDIAVDNAWNHIYYRGTDGKMWAVWYGGGKWNQAPLGGPANVAGDLSVDSTWHFIYYRGTDSHLWVEYFNGSAWTQAKLSATANVGGAVTADAGGLVYYRSDADSSGWAVYFNGQAWVQTVLDATASIGNSTALYGQYNTLYLNTAGQCAAMYWNGANWGHLLLGDAGTGLTGGLSLNPSTHWTFARRNDGHVVVFYYQ